MEYIIITQIWSRSHSNDRHSQLQYTTIETIGTSPETGGMNDFAPKGKTK